jgi:hypothetical protein
MWIVDFIKYLMQGESIQEKKVQSMVQNIIALDKQLSSLVGDEHSDEDYFYIACFSVSKNVSELLKCLGIPYNVKC